MLRFLSHLRRSRSAASPSPRSSVRLRLEGLEDRTLPATFFVVPAGLADGVTRFASLQAALAAPGLGAGSVVQIEPGSAPGNIQNSNLPAVANLTIQGDPAAPLPAIPLFTISDPLLLRTVPATGFTLHNVNVGLVAAGSIVFNTNGAVTDSTVTDYNSSAAAAIVFNGGADALLRSLVVNSGGLAPGGPDLVDVRFAGGDLLSGDTFLAVGRTRSLLAFQAASGLALPEQVLGNAFYASPGSTTGSPLVEIAGVGPAFVVLLNNTLSAFDAGTIGVRLEAGTATQIVGNVITLAGPASTGVTVLGGVDAAAPTVTSAFIQGNQISTNGTGAGLVITTGASAANLVNAKIQGNEFYGNAIAVNVLEAGGPNDGIDLGGGSQGSLGDNDLRDRLPGAPFDTSSSLNVNSAFVAILFNDILRRAGDLSNPNDAGGLVSALNSGAMTQAAVANALVNSREGLGDMVDGLYQRILTYAPDLPNRNGFITMLQNGGTIEQVIAALVQSPEYAAQHPLAEPFTQSLYNNLLGRNAGAAELAAWDAALPTVGRAGEVQTLLTSAEFRADVVNELYGFVIAPAPAVASIFPPLLHRGLNPASAEGNAAINSPLDVLSIYRNFAGSQQAFQGSSGVLVDTPLFVTATLVSSNNTPSIFGQNVTFTAVVTASGDRPTGGVEFFDGTRDIGAGTALTPVGAHSAIATLTVATLPVGGHTIRAVYTPTGDFGGSAASTGQVVDARTSTRAASDRRTSTVGQSVEFTATITNTSGSGGAPTGAVQFFDGTTLLGFGAAPAATGANAADSTFSTSNLAPGDHNIQAMFAPSGAFLTSSGAVGQSVNAVTATALASNNNPSTFGRNVTFTATVTNTTGTGGSPTGAVEFFDGATDLGAGTALTATGANAAASTFTLATLAAGAHNIQAVYAPIGDFNASNGSTTQIVNAATATAVTSGANPSVVGQNVTFTATITNTGASGGAPTGAIEFFDGAIDLGPGSALAPAGANASASTFSLSTLTAGAHSVRAVYTPTGDFLASNGAAVQVVDATTTTVVISAGSPTRTGQPASFTATVTNTSGSGGAPSGAVEFFDGPTDIGPGSALTATGANASASTFTTSTLTAGAHIIGAFYTPAGAFVGSNGSTTQTVNAVTATTVASSNNPSTFGQSVTFTATVTNTGGSGGAPTGAVEFFDGPTDLGAGSALTATGANAAASTFTISTLSAGAHALRAVYTPVGAFVGGSGAVSQVVNAGTTTAVVSSIDPSIFGQPVTFTATITNSSGSGGAPTGSVEFFDGATDLGAGSALTATGANASASMFTTATLPSGADTIRAVYTPAGDFLGSSGSTVQDVQAPTSTTAASGLNPSAFGQSVTFTATVTNTSGNGAPTGSVEFFDGATDIGPGSALTAGIANAATSAFTTAILSVGSHGITAVYTPTGDFVGSSGSTTQVVDAQTSTLVASSIDPSTVGQNVTFTATVTNTSGGGGAPTGNVEFFDGATILGFGTVLNATGATRAASSFTTSTLSSGAHQIRAFYVPTGDFVGSNGSTTQDVDAFTATTVASSNNPSTFGQNVTFTATITNTSGGGAGAPTGFVEFFDGGTFLGFGTGPTATGGNTAASTFTTSNLAVGTHNIRAFYVPTGDFIGSSGSTTQDVDAVTSTGVTSNSNPAFVGSNVTFTATITNQSGNGGAPVGFVEFFENGNFLGFGTTLNATGPNTATSTITTSFANTGNFTIEAFFVPFGDFLASNGALTEMVIPIFLR